MNLSLVDISITPYGGDRRQALKNTIETARLVEDLGFQRIWLAEHHNLANAAGRSPEVLIAAVAENTQRINVGSGAVLLNHYSPFKVAELFGTLCELYPGRIDLGIGRATTGRYTDVALQRNRSSYQRFDDSREQLVELLAWLTDDFTENHPLKGKVRSYNDGGLPNVYLLGSSSFSAEAAAELGLAYVFASFINTSGTYPIISTYTRTFQPSEKPYAHKRPKLTLSLSVYVHDTDELALQFSAPMQYMFKQMQSGIITGTYIPEEEALEKLGSSILMERLNNPLHPPRYLIGKTETVAREIKLIRQAYGAEEIMFQIITANHTQRLKSLELLVNHLRD
ncbi:MsnO8 family LLM class oxidoreductase [Proteiniphilum sp.]|uniref:MsnO8 family LLM class oxidoreductase n=1 Tax=Proteiniphilum sp. TaxID=1926877 RepID=UPI002B204301|nr:MsnO8 family LLM class oxidoreductase [Proteiniphilum sp.]MEA4916799.1 MsnO8 family LLM class oxidoreductase [Proteiniphilum sp.]